MITGDISTEIRSMIAEFAGRKIDEILDSSLLEEDLGITGDDSSYIICKIVNKYHIDVQNVNWNYYFDGEGVIPLFNIKGFFWQSIRALVRTNRSKDRDESIKKIPVSIYDLIQSAKTGKWIVGPKISAKEP